MFIFVGKFEDFCSIRSHEKGSNACFCCWLDCLPLFAFKKQTSTTYVRAEAQSQTFLVLADISSRVLVNERSKTYLSFYLFSHVFFACEHPFVLT